MGTIAVHEFVALDGVYENPAWTAEFGFDPAMGETLAAVTGAATAILLGRTTYEMFAPAWSTRTVEDDPGAPFFNDTTKYVVGSPGARRGVGTVGPARRLRRGGDPAAQGRHRRRHLRLRQRHPGPGDARRRPGRPPAPVRLPDRGRRRPTALGRRGRRHQAAARRTATCTPTGSCTWTTDPPDRSDPRRAQSLGSLSSRSFSPSCQRTTRLRTLAMSRSESCSAASGVIR